MLIERLALPEFRDVSCLVTGGLGFIGSNLALALAAGGARVEVVDALVPEHGGDSRNLEHPGAPIPVTVADIGDAGAVTPLVRRADVIFNVAGQVSHLESMADPQRDLDLNVRSHLAFLEIAREVRPSAVVVHTSTRQVYGRPRYLPVDEDHPTAPVDVNGIDKLACEQFHLLYAAVHDMAVSALRLTNVYGPRQCLQRDGLGFLPVFVRRALRGEPIHVYGDGRQQRDCLYVTDVVRALADAAAAPDAAGQIFNLGHQDALGLGEIARLVSAAAGGSSTVDFVPWPSELARIDIGSFAGDFSKAKRMLAWEPLIPFDEGIASTVAFYREHPWYLSSTWSRGASSQLDAFQEAVAQIVRRGSFLLGPELEAFEAELAAQVGARHAVGVASGASAIQLGLAAMGVGPGDEVIVPAFTAVPTAAAVCATGAVPVFADVDAATAALDRGHAGTLVSPRTAAIVPVHLYGRPAPDPDLGVPVLEDAAQAYGALDVVTGRAAVYSFYPTKNLGGIGDGGAVVTDDDELAATVRRRRTHGLTEHYVHTDVSQNFRMSEIEAAWLRLASGRLAAGNARRRAIADAYRAAAPDLCWHADHPRHVHHLCVVRVPDRDAFRTRLAGAGVTTAVHYPVALTQQPAYRRYVTAPCPTAEAWAASCVSLPCFPELTDDEVATVCRALEAP